MKVAGKLQQKAEAEKAAVKTMWFPSFSAMGMGLYQNKDIELEMILPTQKPNPLTGQLEPNIMIDPQTGYPVMGPDGNPVFNMYAWLPLNISLSGAYLVGVMMEQPVYAGGKISAGNKMAGIGAQMADINVELEQMNTIVEVDNAYWTHISVLHKVRLAQQAVDMLATLVEKAGDANEVGMSNRNDLLKAQVEYNKAKLDLQKAQNGLELSRMNLCRITGLPLNADVVAVDTLVSVQPPAELSLTAETIDGRPEYQLLDKSVAMQEQNIRLARADFMPLAGVQAAYSHLGGIELSGTDFSNSGVNVLASVKIPLFHWGEGAKKIKSAKIEKEIREIERDKNKHLLILEAEQSRLNVILAWERVQMNETSVAQAEENLRVTRDNYEVGLETITELLMAQTNWQKANSEMIDSQTDYKIKETAWLRSTGKLKK
ncbi:TolC family protein [Lentimicrobium sp.]